MYDLESVKAREASAQKTLENCLRDMSDAENDLCNEKLTPMAHKVLKWRMEVIRERIDDAKKILDETRRLQSDPHFCSISG